MATSIEITTPLSRSAGLVAAETKVESKGAVKRRHDLDALRAVAMLLGIVLHAALSFAPIPWTVKDAQQSEFYRAGVVWTVVSAAGLHASLVPGISVLVGRWFRGLRFYRQECEVQTVSKMAPTGDSCPVVC